MKESIKKYISANKKIKTFISFKNQREIKKPYKVNWILYVTMIIVSVLGMLFSFLNPPELNYKGVEIIKNLAYGCFASTLVALLIEIVNTKDKNKKAEDIYNAVYSDLQLQFKMFFECWSDFCCVCIKESNYKSEKHTWKEWYSIFKDYFLACDEKTQKRLATFIVNQMEFSIDRLLSNLNLINQQRYLLEINDVFNASIKSNLSDLEFECDALKSTLLREKDKPESLLKWLDTINKDFEKYVENWKDIRYLNYYEHTPYSFGFDYEELEKAIRNTKKF